MRLHGHSTAPQLAESAVQLMLSCGTAAGSREPPRYAKAHRCGGQRAPEFWRSGAFPDARKGGVGEAEQIDSSWSSASREGAGCDEAGKNCPLLAQRCGAALPCSRTSWCGHSWPTQQRTDVCPDEVVCTAGAPNVTLYKRETRERGAWLPFAIDSRYTGGRGWAVQTHDTAEIVEMDTTRGRWTILSWRLSVGCAQSRKAEGGSARAVDCHAVQMAHEKPTKRRSRRHERSARRLHREPRLIP